MKKIKFALFWMVLFLSSQGICYPSLFQNRSENLTRQNHISLDGLLYGSPSDWTIWVNSEKVTPNTKAKLQTIVIEKVTPDEVTFSWTLTGSKQQKYVTIRPGETFCFNDEDTVGQEPYAATSMSSLEDELIIPNADK